MKKFTATLFLILITSLGFSQVPSSSAPVQPVRIATDVISIYGSAYTNISGVNTNPNWNQTTAVSEVSLSGNNALQYANFGYQGTDWSSTPQNISSMEFLHVDIWTNTQTPSVYVISGGAEVPHAISSVAGAWQSLNIPVAGLTGNLTNAIQFKFDGGTGGTIYVDNLYFWKTAAPAGTPVIGNLTVPTKIVGDAPFNLTNPISNSPGTFSYTSSDPLVATVIGNTVTVVGAGTTIITANQAASAPFLAGSRTANLIVSLAPSVAAPTPPVRNSGDVISLFSNAYTPVVVDSWSAPWDDSDIADVQVAGNDAKKITFTNFIGVDFSAAGHHIDASAMTYLHMDFWTATPNLIGKVLNLKFVDFGGGIKEASNFLLHLDDATNPAIQTGSWVSIDVPITQFSAPLTRNDIAQFLITSNIGIVYVDNIYFYKGTTPVIVESTVPLVAAPTPPARNPGDVVSLFSNAYSNITIDSWSATWDDSSYQDVLIVGNDTKKITFSNFLGVDFSGAGHHKDISTMTNFHMDFWTASPDLIGKVLNSKFVNFGGTAGETSNMLLHLDDATNPAIIKWSWVSIDVPLTQFGGSLTRNDIAQFVMTSNLGIVYVDNIYFYKGTALGATTFDKSNVKMYPNPVKNTLTIEANVSINKVSVYTILGQEVLMSVPKTNTTTVQTGVLQKGVYIVKTDIDGKISTSKIIKE